jgi:lysophospholipase L1-like esterase
MVRRPAPRAKPGPFLDAAHPGVDAGRRGTGPRRRTGMTRRRHAIRLPTVLALAGLLLVLCGAPVPARAAPVWVAFGDSLTQSMPFPWTELLERATGHPVINAGIAGNTTADALKRLDADVLRHHPDLVLVMFGVNDQEIPDGAAPGAYAVPPQAFAANLDAIVTRIQATGARVVLLTNRPLVQGPGAPGATFYLDRHGDRGALYTLPRKTKDTIRLYNDIVRAKARERHTALVDIWQAVVDRAGSDSDADLLKLGIGFPGRHDDGVHLGLDGSLLYARTILEAMPFR